MNATFTTVGIKVKDMVSCDYKLWRGRVSEQDASDEYAVASITCLCAGSNVILCYCAKSIWGVLFVHFFWLLFDLISINKKKQTCNIWKFDNIWKNPCFSVHYIKKNLYILRHILFLKVEIGCHLVGKKLSCLFWGSGGWWLGERT